MCAANFKLRVLVQRKKYDARMMVVAIKESQVSKLY